MSAEILRGKPIADKIKEQILKEVEVLKTKGVEPFLVAVQVGENAASKFYTDFQKKNSEQLGIKYELKELPAETTQAELIKCIEVELFFNCLFPLRLKPEKFSGKLLI
jgi:methylenetetrahydrofolate dehydrogenase (NADP+)/methenyltetrahydrofolate cyclohydrolase